jgi:acetate kinase
MNSYILVFNAGSATLKFKIFNSEDLSEINSGAVERIGLPGSFLTVGRNRFATGKILNHTLALKKIMAKISISRGQIKFIGHRVVHGGEEFQKPTLITPSILKKLSAYSQLAPLHNPVNLAVIKACYNFFPGAKNIAVFDTAFFRYLKPEVFLYSLPWKYYSRYHIRKYGFHGISHSFVASAAAKKLKRPLHQLNLITCHFGNGDSIAAIKNGKPIDTTMGFTPLEGLTMGTRSGDLDPSIPIFLIQQAKMKPAEVNKLLNTKSGLLAISGFTSDMREILHASGHQVRDYTSKRFYSVERKRRARLALSMFIYDVRRYLSAYLGLLGKVDAIIFTGGIGERSPVIRKFALQGFKFHGRPHILTIHTDEERAIAQEILKSNRF